MNIVFQNKFFFDGGNTTGTVFENNGAYSVKVLTRFNSGNYLMEVDEGDVSFEKAKGYVMAYTN